MNVRQSYEEAVRPQKIKKATRTFLVLGETWRPKIYLNYIIKHRQDFPGIDESWLKFGGD